MLLLRLPLCPLRSRCCCRLLSLLLNWYTRYVNVTAPRHNCTLLHMMCNPVYSSLYFEIKCCTAYLYALHSAVLLKFHALSTCSALRHYCNWKHIVYNLYMILCFTYCCKLCCDLPYAARLFLALVSG